MIIEMPTSTDHRASLEEKANEYQKRFEAGRSEESIVGSFCKLTILNDMIQNGQTDTDELLGRTSGKFPGITDSEHFTVAYVNACHVIHDYVTTGGLNCCNGTGLPVVTTVLADQEGGRTLMGEVTLE